MDNYIAFIIITVAVIAGTWYAIYNRKRRHKELVYKDENKPLKLQQAFDLVKDDHDFDGVYVIAGHLYKDIWGAYKGSIIVIADDFLEWAPIGKIACVIVHELAHHQGKNEAQAAIIGKDCYKNLGVK